MLRSLWFGLLRLWWLKLRRGRPAGPPAQRPPAPRAVRRRRAAPQGGGGPAARRRPTAAGFFASLVFSWCGSCRAPRELENPSTFILWVARSAERREARGTPLRWLSPRRATFFPLTFRNLHSFSFLAAGAALSREDREGGVSCTHLQNVFRQLPTVIDSYRQLPTVTDSFRQLPTRSDRRAGRYSHSVLLGTPSECIAAVVCCRGAPLAARFASFSKNHQSERVWRSRRGATIFPPLHSH